MGDSTSIAGSAGGGRSGAASFLGRWIHEEICGLNREAKAEEDQRNLAKNQDETGIEIAARFANHVGSLESNAGSLESDAGNESVASDMGCFTACCGGTVT